MSFHQSFRSHHLLASAPNPFSDAAKLLLVQKIVPQDVREVPHAFESVGHIAHLNLRDELLPYKHIIGQVTPLTRHLVRAVAFLFFLALAYIAVEKRRTSEIPKCRTACHFIR